VIKSGETVVGLLTGHILKDPEATIAYHEERLAGIMAQYPNQIYNAEPTVEAIAEILGERVTAQV
jgi:threonine synthase